MVAAMKGSWSPDLTIDEVDALTGPLLGRAKSATFRTADITGLDVLLHVSKGLSASTGEDFSMPEWVEKLAASGRLGEKTQAGFYKKVGKGISTLDWKTLGIRTAEERRGSVARRAPEAAAGAAVEVRDAASGKYGEFVRNYLLRMSHYVLKTSPSIAYDLVAVDRAIEWGYAWEAGPFQQMDALGHDFLRDGFARLGLDTPPLLAAVKDGHFFHASADGSTYLTDAGGYLPVPPVPGQIALDQLRTRKGAVVESSRDANIVDLGDGVLLLEARSKMNTMGAGVLAMLRTALDRVANGKYEGLVIGNDDPRAYSAGADLGSVVQQVQSADWKGSRRWCATSRKARSSCAARPFPSSPPRSGSRSAAARSTRCTQTASRRTPSCTWGSSKRASGSSRRRRNQGAAVPITEQLCRTTRPIRSRA
jgi:3-hydroxyacyl-CoA dehydrogenase